jgi:hypothetical protein
MSDKELKLLVNESEVEFLSGLLMKDDPERSIDGRQIATGLLMKLGLLSKVLWGRRLAKGQL